MLSGQIESLIALRDGLESAGHTVRVVSAFAPEQLRRGQRWALDSGDGLALAPKVVRIGNIVSRIAVAARECDVLHFNVPTPAFSMLADVLQIMTGRPVVVGFEAHLADVGATARRLLQAPEFYGPRLVVNNGAVARMTLRRAKRYVVSSDFQRRELASLGYRPEQVCVVPNLIDEYKLKRWDQEAAREALGLPSGPLVAFVGHYHDVKGHDVLIRAFPAVLEKVPDARLVLAWSGIGHRSRVQNAIAAEGIGDQVIELGRLDVAQLFSAADVAALPYRFTIGQAAYPGTVIEAMWVGVPLVTSGLPLLAELSDQGATALLARPGDAQDLARQIVRALTEPTLREALVEAQRATIATRFQARARIDDYVEIYREAITGQANLLQPAGN